MVWGRFIDFNKELLFGEIGALISAPVFSYLASRITDTPGVISTIAVIGAIFGASCFWIFMRSYDEKRRKEFSAKHLMSDISYFTPGAFLLTLLVYYPTLFFMSRHLLTQDYRVVLSVIFSQCVAFLLFLIAVNFYRLLIWKALGKEL